MTLEQREKLTQLGFDWETREEKEEHNWNVNFESLKVYKKKHRDCCVPLRWASGCPGRERFINEANYPNIERKNSSQWSLHGVFAPLLPREILQRRTIKWHYNV
jgi:hypothetical protein